MKITFIVGTRPELIKVAPVIWEAQNRNVEFDIVNTAQHKDLLDPYWDAFNITPTHVLDVMRPNQNLASLTGRAINGIQEYLDNESTKPHIILAQGDTTTVMAASMISFYNRISFAHLEAGLRSFDFKNPFPEEYNRKIASIAANYHFCPTNISKGNLLKESVEKNKIYVVGNTIVDALNNISSDENFLSFNWTNKNLYLLHNFEKSVLITCHRRENQGENLNIIINSIIELSIDNKDVAFVWPLHPNPNVRNTVLKSELKDLDNVLLIDPLEYMDLLKLLNLSFCAISDSGGIQEEAPSFNTPVIVLRETTERPEGVDAGVAFLVGADKEQIKKRFDELMNRNITFDSNPYGDGRSSKKIIDILKEKLY